MFNIGEMFPLQTPQMDLGIQALQGIQHVYKFNLSESDQVVTSSLPDEVGGSRCSKAIVSIFVNKS